MPPEGSGNPGIIVREGAACQDVERIGDLICSTPPLRARATAARAGRVSDARPNEAAGPTSPPRCARPAGRLERVRATSGRGTCHDRASPRGRGQPGAILIFLHAVRHQADRLLLPGGCRLKVAGLGVGGGEGVEQHRKAPFRHLAGAGRGGEGLLAVAVLRVRAGRQERRDCHGPWDQRG